MGSRVHGEAPCLPQVQVPILGYTETFRGWSEVGQGAKSQGREGQMNGKPKRAFTKSDDYATVHADGVIVQNTVSDSRLVFYQRELEPDDSKEKFTTDPERITLKFEVRVPRFILYGLAKNIEADTTFRGEVGNLSRDADEDREVLESWNALTDKLDRVVLDDEGKDIGDIHRADLKAEYDRLAGHKRNRAQ